MSIIRKEQLTNPLSASYAETASYALNASTSTVDTSSLVTTSSFNAFTSSINAFTASYNTGSFSGSFTGSLNGTASWATNALTASYVNPLRQDVIITGSLLLTQSHISTVDYIDYRVIQTHPTHVEGRTHWLDDTKTLQIDTDVNNFSIEVGHQSVVRVRNTTGYDLAAGKVVYINGESGNRPTITTASWDGDPTSAATLGFVAQQINDNQTGYVVTNGMLRGINTTAFTPGDQLYLSSSGNYTSTIPISPKHEVRLGKVVTSANDGVIYVDIMNGYELGELHDVLINGSTNGDLVVKSGSLWINSKQLTGSYGLTGSLTATSFTGSLSGIAATASYYQETDPIFTSKSASLATTGSNNFKGNQNITGSVNITGSLIVNDGTYNVVDTTQRFLNDNGGTATIDWQNKVLKQAGNRDTVNWNSAYLNDYTSQNLSIDWETRKLYASDGTTSTLDWSSNLIITSPTFFTTTISTNSQETFSSTSNYAGTVIRGTIDGNVVLYNLIYLDTDGTWYQNNQGNTSSSKKLGIYLDNNLVLIEGHIVTDNGINGFGPSVQAVQIGVPIFIREGAGTNMSCTNPNVGYVRILGHIYYQNQNDNNLHIMRFNPSNDYYLLG